MTPSFPLITHGHRNGLVSRYPPVCISRRSTTGAALMSAGWKLVRRVKGWHAVLWEVQLPKPCFTLKSPRMGAEVVDSSKEGRRANSFFTPGMLKPPRARKHLLCPLLSLLNWVPCLISHATRLLGSWLCAYCLLVGIAVVIVEALLHSLSVDKHSVCCRCKFFLFLSSDSTPRDTIGSY